MLQSKRVNYATQAAAMDPQILAVNGIVCPASTCICAPCVDLLRGAPALLARGTFVPPRQQQEGYM